MHCEDIQSLFIPYLKGKLEGPQRQQVELHLATCASCQAEFEFDQKVISDLPSKLELPPLSPHFNQIVLAQATAIREPFSSKLLARGVERPWVVSTAGMIFSLILTLSYFAWNTFGSGVDFFFAWFPVMPLMISLMLLIMLGIIYVNEKFIEKFIFSSKNGEN